MKRSLLSALSLWLAMLSPGLAAPVDPTVARPKYSKEHQTELIRRYNSAPENKKPCLSEYIRNYQGSLFKYCVATDGGKNIGGGCDHVAYAYSIHEGVLELALEKCKVPTAARR